MVEEKKEKEMNWMKNLPNFIKVLQSGEELAKAATWKNVQGLTSALTALAGALVLVLDPTFRYVDNEVIAAGVAGVVAVVGSVNAYLTYASSKKVGFKNADKN
jgi:hypothetical protein